MDDHQHAKEIVPEKCIYISLAKARRRRVANEQKVCDILQPRGFLPVFAEDIAISEIGVLVRGADTIVVPHGAGAANVVFARPGIQVLELFGAHIAPEGWLLTHAVDGKHFGLAGTDDAGRYQWEARAYPNLSLAERNAADYVVDPTQLSKALEVMEG